LQSTESPTVGWNCFTKKHFFAAEEESLQMSKNANFLQSFANFFAAETFPAKVAWYLLEGAATIARMTFGQIGYIAALGKTFCSSVKCHYAVLKLLVLLSECCTKCHHALYHNVECHYGERRHSECHYCNCHNAESHFALCHYTLRHNAQRHNAECNYAECQYAEWRYAEWSNCKIDCSVMSLKKTDARKSMSQNTSLKFETGLLKTNI